MGIWPKGGKHSQVTSCNRSCRQDLLVTADEKGLVKLFRYPCVFQNAANCPSTGHSNQVTCARFSPKGERVVSVGGVDGCIVQWVVVLMTNEYDWGSSTQSSREKPIPMHSLQRAHDSIAQQHIRLERELQKIARPTYTSLRKTVDGEMFQDSQSRAGNVRTPGDRHRPKSAGATGVGGSHRVKTYYRHPTLETRYMTTLPSEKESNLEEHHEGLKQFRQHLQGLRLDFSNMTP